MRRATALCDIVNRWDETVRMDGYPRLGCAVEGYRCNRLAKTTMQTTAASDALRTVRVWDLPTRIFHWLLVIAIVGSITTGQIGGGALVWHFRFGYIVLTLLVFRLVWGFVGGHWSRFSTFFPSPGKVARYLRGAPHIDDHFDVGHSPLAALAVFAMLLMLAVQVATGMVAEDESGRSGPLFTLVGAQMSRLATAWHREWGQWMIYTLIVMHIGAIIVYRVRFGRNLVRAMIAGDKHLQPEHAPAAHDTLARRLFAAVLITACAAAVTMVISLG